MINNPIESLIIITFSIILGMLITMSTNKKYIYHGPNANEYCKKIFYNKNNNKYYKFHIMPITSKLRQCIKN